MSSSAKEKDRSNYDINFWNEFDIAVCGFCASQCRKTAESTALIDTLIGHDLDWFGSHGMLFIVNRLIENEVDKHALESRCVAHESSLDTEMSLNRSLRRQLTQTQRASQDNDWRLQEQLVAVTNELQHERNLSEQLREQIMTLETQAEHNDTASISNFGEFSPTNSVSVATTPAQTWRDQARRSLSSTWSGSQQKDKLLKVAEKLNITPNHDDNVM